MTVETPKTAPKSPWYWPRSRGGMMSPTTAIVVVSSPPAPTLQRAERDQLGHVLRDPAERRADEEDHDRDLQRHLAAVEIAELPVERPGDGRRKQIRGDDPREVLESTEVADDGRQCRRDDRQVERCEQDDEDQRAEDHADARSRCCGGVLSHPQGYQSAPRRVSFDYLSHDEDREDRSGVAAELDARAVPRAAPEGHRGAVHAASTTTSSSRGRITAPAAARSCSSRTRSTTRAAAGRRSTRRPTRPRSTRRPTRPTAWSAPR